MSHPPLKHDANWLLARGWYRWFHALNAQRLAISAWPPRVVLRVPPT